MFHSSNPEAAKHRTCGDYTVVSTSMCSQYFPLFLTSLSNKTLHVRYPFDKNQLNCSQLLWTKVWEKKNKLPQRNPHYVSSKQKKNFLSIPKRSPSHLVNIGLRKPIPFCDKAEHQVSGKEKTTKNIFSFDFNFQKLMCEITSNQPYNNFLQRGKDYSLL